MAKQVASRRSFSQVLLSPLLAGAAMALALVVLLSFLLTYTAVRQSFSERYHAVHALFTQMISTSLLTGAYPEVYRRCAMFANEPGVAAVSVALSDGYSLCREERAHGRARLITVEGPIYFGQSGDEVAATVRIVFSDKAFWELLSRAWLSLAAGGALLWILSLVAGRVLARRLSRPLVELSERISGGDLKQLSGLDDGESDEQVEEVHILRGAVSRLAASLLASRRGLVEATEKAAAAAIATQVAHDIRSPLAALNLLVRDSDSLSSDNAALVRGAIERINSIAADLLSRRPRVEAEEALADAMLAAHAHQVVAEKRVLARDGRGSIEFDPGAGFGVFARVAADDFKRVLSNIIDNALDATREVPNGRVAVVVRGGDEAVVEVSDNGPGVPEELLGRLGHERLSVGKRGGTGLGLFHARMRVEAWGGSLRLERVKSGGTRVSIVLPAIPSPSWHVPQLELSDFRAVVVIDDDPSIRELWGARLGKRPGCPPLRAFSSLAEFKRWRTGARLDADHALLLVDVELGRGESGLELADEPRDKGRLIFVTGRYSDDAVISACLAGGAGLIPKPLCGIVPIRSA